MSAAYHQQDIGERSIILAPQDKRFSAMPLVTNTPPRPAFMLYVHGQPIEMKEAAPCFRSIIKG